MPANRVQFVSLMMVYAATINVITSHVRSMEYKIELRYHVADENIR